jgi:hypothetical protein
MSPRAGFPLTVEDVVTVTNRRGIFAAGSTDSGDVRFGDVVERASRPRGAGTGKSAAGRQRPGARERHLTSKEISHRLGCHLLSDSG